MQNLEGAALPRSQVVMNHERAIIVVDDCLADRELIESCLRTVGVACPVHMLTDGSVALAYLAGEGGFSDRSRFPLPSLVLTDLKMLGVDGFAVLNYVRTHPRLHHIPVVLLSGSEDSSDVEVAYDLGASGYIVKSAHLDDFRYRLKIVLEYWNLCATPENSQEGLPKKTDCRGKLGERFSNENVSHELPEKDAHRS